MMHLPKIPTVNSNVKYPAGQLEAQLDAVMRTNPQDYLKKIKEHLREIHDYKACLEAHGYSISLDTHTLNPEAVFAKKEVFIR